MAQKNLFDFVKGMIGGGQQPQMPMQPRPPRPRYEPPPQRPVDPDDHNPGTIVRIGKSTDGRELLMTLALGTFLLDRETPTICYYQRGAVAAVPTPELRYLRDCLMEKRNVGEYATQYVDLLNVAAFELESRTKRERGAGRQAMPAAPQPLPRPAPAKQQAPRPRWPDHENPATITRVGRSNNGGELIMTLGLGTFVLHREEPDLKYFDRGREWQIQDQDLRLLVEALMLKQDMKEFQYAYVDLLNVANYLQDRRRAGRRR